MIDDIDDKEALRGTHATAAENDVKNGAEILADDVIEAENFDEPAQDLFMPAQENAFQLPIDAALIGENPDRVRGRPPGSKNKKQVELTQYLLAMGMHSPLQAGAALYNMELGALCAKLYEVELKQYKTHRQALSDAANEAVNDDAKEEILKSIKLLDVPKPPNPMEVLKVQAKVMSDQLPYWHSKVTPGEDVPDRVIPILQIGTMNTQYNTTTNVMSAGIAPTANVEENQQVSEADIVPQDE